MAVLGLALVLIAGLYAWLFIGVIRGSRNHARWEKETGVDPSRPEPDENNRRSRRAAGLVYLSFGILIALSYPMWSDTRDGDHWAHRFYCRGMATMVGLLVLGVLVVWATRRRRSR